MKKFTFLIIAMLMVVSVLMVACQPSTVHVDDNGASDTNYGEIDDPTPISPLATDAETGEPIDDEPGEAFVLDDCDHEDIPPIYMEPNDDTGPGDGWGDNYEKSKTLNGGDSN